MRRRRRLLWRLFPSYLAISLSVLLLTALFVLSAAKDLFLQQIESGLDARADFVITHISGKLLRERLQEIDTFCKELGPKTGTRITVIGADGAVLGDSDEVPANMENHSSRPEIAQALRGERGSAKRFSETVKKDLLYVAHPIIRDGSVIGVARTALPLAPIDEMLFELRLKLFGIGIAFIAIVAAVCYLVSRGISLPIERMKTGAEKFSAGDLSHKLELPDSVELAQLALTLNQMARNVRSQIATVREQKNALDAVLSSMEEGVLALDPDQKILSINPAAEKLFSIQAAQCVGRAIIEVVRNSEFQKFVGQALSSEDGTLSQEILFSADVEHYLFANATPLKDSTGARMGVLVVLNDLTQLKRLENIRRDFVANVSHELRTPITTIKGFSETLLDGAMHNPEDAKRFLTIIGKQSERLHSIIQDLLSLARLEEQRTEIPRKVEPLWNILRSAIDVCAHHAEKKEISIELAASKDLAIPVNAPLLEQAVVNLVDNAIKYSPDKSTITVSSESSDREIIIAIRDQGPGIDREHLPRLFERFYRVDKGRSRAEGGTGLGLAIVKHIAQAHGGYSEVESSLGKGSTFSIHIPV